METNATALACHLLELLLAPRPTDDGPTGSQWTIAGEGPMRRLEVKGAVVLVPEVPGFSDRSDSLFMRSDAGALRILEFGVLRELPGICCDVPLAELVALAQRCLDRFFGGHCLGVYEARNMEVLMYHTLWSEEMPAVTVWSDDGRHIGCLWSFQAVLDAAREGEGEGEVHTSPGPATAVSVPVASRALRRRVR